VASCTFRLSGVRPLRSSCSRSIKFVFGFFGRMSRPYFTERRREEHWLTAQTPYAGPLSQRAVPSVAINEHDQVTYLTILTCNFSAQVGGHLD
jgi:hypothetical protein